MLTDNELAPIVVASTTLQALFGGDGVLADDGSVIRGQLSLPEYQRPYRWNTFQLERFVVDLAQFATQSRSNGPDGNAYYLGSIILHQGTAEPGKPEVLNIIDGQQRLTSMAILGCLLGTVPSLPGLRFSPESQARIKANTRWLRTRPGPLPQVDFSRVNITLVVTSSEDDAYRFFETQNTGGVRLDGPAIMKAHHLRAVKRENQDAFARQWESMGELALLVDAVMKTRHWQGLRWRELASYREPSKMRDEVVAELQGKESADRADIAYRPVRFSHDAGGWSQHLAANGYAMRQPLNTGVNTIRYLQYFQALRKELFVAKSDPALSSFHMLYRSLSVKARPSDFLHKLFDAALLLYASQFGTGQLFEASLWLFRAIASPRLSNKTTVRESTVQAFARSSLVLDQVAASYNHDELMEFLRDFSYVVDPSSLKDGTVKFKFINNVAKELDLAALPTDPDALAKSYDRNLVDAIRRLTHRAPVPEKVAA